MKYFTFFQNDYTKKVSDMIGLIKQHPIIGVSIAINLSLLAVQAASSPNYFILSFLSDLASRNDFEGKCQVVLDAVNDLEKIGPFCWVSAGEDSSYCYSILNQKNNNLDTVCNIGEAYNCDMPFSCNKI
ncbi:hypothetical protein [Legionella tunisiensis]|uniref:hypothetical protein n=1 Tax=Legionella tunisiensis TaxID=1034944 RepID=UPI000369F2A1|nr:hypothetical protein [Legionella tunisiensis]